VPREEKIQIMQAKEEILALRQELEQAGYE
jgi:hypothetical protein